LENIERHAVTVMTRAPIHPGEFLIDELKEIGISPTELSRQIDVPPNRISQIVRGKRDVTADTALRLGRFFGTGPEFWMNLQNAYDLDKAKAELGPTIRKIHQWKAQVGVQQH
jgi:addiction module HigA family antidote